MPVPKVNQRRRPQASRGQQRDGSGPRPERLRHQPDLVTPPDAFAVEGQREPSWLEVELGRMLPATTRRGQWHGRVPLGEHMEVRVRLGKRVAVQELAPGSYLVNEIDSDAVTAGEVELGILPAIMAINAIRNLLPERFLAKLRLKKHGVPEDKELMEEADAADVEGFGCECRACLCRK